MLKKYFITVTIEIKNTETNEVSNYAVDNFLIKNGTRYNFNGSKAMAISFYSYNSAEEFRTNFDFESLPCFKNLTDRGYEVIVYSDFMVTVTIICTAMYNLMKLSELFLQRLSRSGRWIQFRL